jgi:energy-coupling factor transporter ATP-binding protein EcfA2
MLKRLILNNFRSIASASIDFSQFTFLVGRNGSGKSNIADALAFLAEATEWPLQTVFNRRGGAWSVARRRPLRSERMAGAPIEFGIGVELAELPITGRRAARSHEGTPNMNPSLQAHECINDTHDAADSPQSSSPVTRTNASFMRTDDTFMRIKQLTCYQSLSTFHAVRR